MAVTALCVCVCERLAVAVTALCEWLAVAVTALCVCERLAVAVSCPNVKTTPDE